MLVFPYLRVHVTFYKHQKFQVNLMEKKLYLKKIPVNLIGQNSKNEKSGRYTLEVDIKAQTNSKGFFQADVSSKKPTKKFVFTT